jgi:hypothetical protein
MDRVVVTKCMMGIFAMQACAQHDASDEEILEVCNRENFAGTSQGWCRVVREPDEDYPNTAPVVCEKDPSRLHFVIYC